MLASMPTKAQIGDRFNIDRTRSRFTALRVDRSAFEKDAKLPTDEEASAWAKDAANQQAIKAAYEEQKSRFEQPKQVKASHILAKFKKGDDAAEKAAKKKIDEAKAKLDAGDDFGEVAKAFSDDGSAAKGGDLGFFGPGRMVKPLKRQPLRSNPMRSAAWSPVSSATTSSKSLRSKRASTQTLDEAQAELAKELLQKQTVGKLARAHANLVLTIIKNGVDLKISSPRARQVTRRARPPAMKTPTTSKPKTPDLSRLSSGRSKAWASCPGSLRACSRSTKKGLARGLRDRDRLRRVSRRGARSSPTTKPSPKRANGSGCTSATRSGSSSPKRSATTCARALVLKSTRKTSRATPTDDGADPRPCVEPGRPLVVAGGRGALRGGGAWGAEPRSAEHRQPETASRRPYSRAHCGLLGNSPRCLEMAKVITDWAPLWRHDSRALPRLVQAVGQARLSQADRLRALPSGDLSADRWCAPSQSVAVVMVDTTQGVNGLRRVSERCVSLASAQQGYLIAFDATLRATAALGSPQAPAILRREQPRGSTPATLALGVGGYSLRAPSPICCSRIQGPGH